ncbi:MAG: flavodoxin domain-containing protein [Syntrophobacteraceae bacterium]|nr:flavodoxin domain-containing protein [Syntrophobacteraceae bacterium]
MKALNLYFSATGNTEKIAKQIDRTLGEQGVLVDSVKVSKDGMEPDILAYDLVLAGSGVYTWLPGKPMIALFDKLREKYVREGDILPASPRRQGKRAVVYCTYGGAHTGVKEAVPAVKFLAQLFDHLGFEVIDEWYFVGEYNGKLRPMSLKGRLGNIEGRPSEADLREVSEKVVGIMRV